MAAFAFAEVSVAAGVVLAIEHVPETGEHGFLQRRGEVLEGEGVDHVAAAMLEEAVEELEVLQTAAVTALRGFFDEGGLEGGIALDAAFGQSGLVFEKQRIENVLGAMIDARV